MRWMRIVDGGKERKRFLLLLHDPPGKEVEGGRGKEREECKNTGGSSADGRDRIDRLEEGRK